jgi:hypothetical protein
MALGEAVVVEIGFQSNPGTAIGSTTWTDVTSDVISVQTHRGRQRELDQFAAGTCTVVLDNRARRYDPSYTGAGSPYNGNIKPMRRIRVSAGTVSIANLLTANQASLETDTTGWTGNINCTISRTTAVALVGVASLQMSSTAAGTMTAITPTGASGVAVSPDAVYTASASFRTAVTSRSCDVRISWYTSAGAFISTDSATPITDATGSWTQCVVSAVSPSNAAFAAIDVRVLSTGAGSEVHYVDDIGLFCDEPYYLFSGFVDGWEQRYDPPNNAVAVVTATDGFKVLNAATMRGAYEAGVINDSPNVYWRLGDPTGATTLVPTVGTGDLVISGSPTLGAAGLQSSDTDTSVTFASGQYAEVNGVNPLSGTAFSVEFYINTTDASTACIMEVYSGTSASGVDDDVGFNASITSGGVLDFFAARTDSSSNLRLQSTVAINDGVPHHVVVTMTSGNTGKVYVDGTDRTSTASALNGSGGFLPGRVRIGGTAAANNFDGTLDEVAIYPTALSAAQVADHYAARNGWASEASGTRIGRMLDLAAWPSADRDVDTGQSTLQTLGAGSFDPLSHSQAVETTEQGRFFIAANGRVVFLDRKVLSNAPYNTSQATFGDGGGSELPYAGISYRYDDQLVWNEIVATRDGGVARIASDSDSQASYLKRTRTMSGLHHTTDVASGFLAQWVLAKYKDPLLRVTGLRIIPDASPTDLYPQALGREIGDRITVKRRPQGVGSVISQEVQIEGISHMISPGSWETQWDLSPANSNVMWLLGVANSSELGTTTRLGF